MNLVLLFPEDFISPTRVRVSGRRLEEINRIGSDELRVGNDRDALRFPKSRHAPDVAAVLQVEHFDRVVSECRDVQSLSGS